MNKILIVILFFAGPLAGQVISPSAASAFEAQHHFNQAFIKTKGIKRITFEIIDKKDYEVAVDKSLIEMYEFNADGVLSRYYYTSIIKTIEKQVTTVSRKKKHTYVVNEYVYDTIGTSYFYDGPRLILKRYHDGADYYESRYYRYDTTGRLTKELRFRETNNSPKRSLFVLGNQVELSVDSFQYVQHSSGQVKRIYLNNENRPYKETITNYDAIGREKSVHENYTAAGWIIQEHTYEYEGDQLCVARFTGNANNKIALRNTYEYDENNELYAERQYKNDVLVREISYVTDRTNGLLNSFIVRDPEKKTMRIVKLKYDVDSIGQNGK